MAPAAKKRRVTKKQEESVTNGNGVHGESTAIPKLPYPPVTFEEKNNWQGFCEIESEPAFFNAMLKDFGVKGVKVQEVLGLDPELLAMLPQPVYGLIFLFRYRSGDENKQEPSCPEHVWFANQTHEFACATVSLLNIVNNLASVDIGDHLRSFKDFTEDFTPAIRGDQIGNFEFVKRIHNSFARKMDMYCIDLGLENKYDDRRKKNSSKKKSKTITDDDYIDDDAAFHFIGFVPIDGEVWKLDGLDRQPEKIGPIGDGSDWLSIVIPELTARMAQYEENQIEFSLLSLVKDPLFSHRSALHDLEQSIGNHENKPPHGDLLSGKEATINGSTDVPSIINEAHEKAFSNSNRHGKEYNPEIDNLQRLIADEEALVSDENRRAEERKHDYAPIIYTWLKMLTEQEGVVKELIESSQ